MVILALVSMFSSQQRAICLLAQLVLKISGSLFPRNLGFTLFLAAPCNAGPRYAHPMGAQRSLPFLERAQDFLAGTLNPKPVLSCLFRALLVAPNPTAPGTRVLASSCLPTPSTSRCRRDPSWVPRMRKVEEKG